MGCGAAQSCHGGFCGAVLTLAVVFSGLTVFAPSGGNLVVEDVTPAHMRSLLAGHLIDVASTNQHTVKPWFNGRVDVSPPVGNFVAQGFRLVGGELDYVGQRIVAVTVYRRGNHVINLFSWPDNGRNSLPRQRGADTTSCSGVSRASSFALFPTCRWTTWAVSLCF